MQTSSARPDRDDDYSPEAVDRSNADEQEAARLDELDPAERRIAAYLLNDESPIPGSRE